MKEEFSEHFRQFTSSLNSQIGEFTNLSEEELVQLQKVQIEELARLEKLFRTKLSRSKVAGQVYEEFIAHIRDGRKNILMGRLYFRARQDVFADKISSALENRDWKKLRRFHINHAFIARVIKNEAQFELPKALVIIANDHRAARRRLISVNLPLVIFQASIFWKRTPKSHLTFMDLVQIGTLGLIAAVDKFCLPYSPVFCSVAIGRMLANFIEWYSDTMLHFYPSDRRRLYRAHKARARDPHNVLDFEELAAAVNERKPDDDRPIKLATPDDVADLVAAASVVSADVRVPGEPDIPTSVARYEAPPEARPDVQFETAELRHKLHAAIKRLPLLDQKMLRLKGIEVDL
jgi:RNA polymerase sigma factor (sigma-70 family)